MGYAEALLQHALKLAEEKGAKEIKKIRIAIGELLLINPEQLKFCFSAIASNTIAENAELEIEFLKAEGKCITCGKVFDSIDSTTYICNCGGLIEFKGGKDFILKSLSLEV
jgi:hydrogenase nickel incorporation protein HypA/HybF